MIFISYRRSDSLHFAARIYDRLRVEFGAENVFMDIENIPIGVTFPSYLEEVISHCRVVLAIIGGDWIGENGNGIPRIFEKDDYVRIELETACRENTMVIPVLVSGTTMPNKKELPYTINELALINAAVVDDEKDFHYHVGQLIGNLHSILGREAGSKDLHLLAKRNARESIEHSDTGAENSHSNKPSRRAFLGVAILGVGSLFAYASGGYHYIVKRLKSRRHGIVSDNFIRNKKTGVVHHIDVCADHLPKEFGHLSHMSEDLERKIHRQKLPHIATIQVLNSMEPGVVDLVLASLQTRPTSVHLYKYLISIWGKDKDYDRIHSFLSSSIEYLSHRLNQTKSNPDISNKARIKLERKYAKAIRELNQRKVRADFLASVSKAKQM